MPVMGWNQWVKWVAPFSIAQSFMALATTLAIVAVEAVPLVDGFLETLVGVVRQALFHHRVVEDHDAKQFGHTRHVSTLL